MSVDSMKRPLMMATLNGLYVSRMPVPENPREDVSAKANTDEMVRERAYILRLYSISFIDQSGHEVESK